MSERWSQRARDRIHVLREEQAWVESANTMVVRDSDGRLRWWTFAGQRANHVLAQVLSGLTSSKVRVGNLALEFECRLTLEDIEGDMTILRLSELDAVMFSACLPTEMALEMLGERLADVSGAKQVLNQPVRLIAATDQQG